MMKTLIVLTAILALCAALPSETIEAHEEAQNEVTALLQSGGTDTTCRKLAQDTIKQIKSSVTTIQKETDVMPKGKYCHKEGQEGVDSATRRKKHADRMSRDADKARSKACTAQVKFAPKALSSLSGGRCGSFFSDAAYVSAKRKCDAAKKNAEKLRGAANQAKKGLVAAMKTAEAAKKRCQCQAQKVHKKAKKSVAGANSAANRKAWVKAHHMLCVLANRAASKCLVPAVPTVKLGALHKGAASAKCSSAKPKKKKPKKKPKKKKPKKKTFKPLTSGHKTVKTRQGGKNPPGVTFHQHCIRDKRRSTGGKITAYKSYKSPPVGWMYGTSTVTITPGWQVMVFDKKNYRGTTKVLSACGKRERLYDFCNIRKGGRGTWNDKMRSFQISKC